MCFDHTTCHRWQPIDLEREEVRPRLVTNDLQVPKPSRCNKDGLDAGSCQECVGRDRCPKSHLVKLAAVNCCPAGEAEHIANSGECRILPATATQYLGMPQHIAPIGHDISKCTTSIDGDPPTRFSHVSLQPQFLVRSPAQHAIQRRLGPQ